MAKSKRKFTKEEFERAIELALKAGNSELARLNGRKEAYTAMRKLIDEELKRIDYEIRYRECMRMQEYFGMFDNEVSDGEEKNS